jgi:hypothetical protein
MGVVVETCIKYPGGPTRMTGTDIVIRFTAVYSVLYSNCFGHTEYCINTAAPGGGLGWRF